jgi:arylsulfatase A-like enzyme
VLRPSRARVALAALLVVGITAALVVATNIGGSGGGRGQRLHPSKRPNIVFVLTDDLSLNLLPYMPHVQALEQQGMTFSDYFVSDSLCCPSRASIFTGQYPHDDGIFSNVGPDGGFHKYYERGEARRSFPVALQRAGYETAMMGKFLNGYLQRRMLPRGLKSTYRPPGWSEWDVAGDGYPEFDYVLNENGKLRRYGHKDSDYLTDVIAGKGADFIDRSVRASKPFFLELASFAPHSPYVPAPSDRSDFPGLRAPRPANFDVQPTDPPRWLAGRPPLTTVELRQIDRVFRLRVEDVQSIDRMIGTIERTLAADHVTGNTYIVFSSDNGLHTGEYRLMPGKMTAFDTDIHVPLVIAGPGIHPDASTNVFAENVDLAETFSAIAGARFRTGDGHTLLGLLHGAPAPDWRNAVLIEHHGPVHRPDDPDFQSAIAGDPPSYRAIRTGAFLYVEYADGEREFYDLRRDPFELHNVATELTLPELAGLHAELSALGACHGGAECWAAGHIAQPALVPGVTVPASIGSTSSVPSQPARQRRRPPGIRHGRRRRR